MNTIVIGVDGSERSSGALALARRLAVPATQLVVVCADPAGSRLAAVEHEAGVERLAVADRDPARALQRVAVERRASLIVVGSSRKAMLRRVGPGSVGQRLLHGTPCPVAVAPSGYGQSAAEPIAVVGCAFDGSPESHRALACATDTAQRLRASVRLLHCVDPPGPLDAVLAVETQGAAAAHRLRERPAADLHRLAEELGADAALLHGAAADELVRSSFDVDLLVLGSRGYGPVRGTILGSVSARVVCGAACPVIVVPRARAGH